MEADVRGSKWWLYSKETNLKWTNPDECVLYLSFLEIEYYRRFSIDECERKMMRSIAYP